MMKSNKILSTGSKTSLATSNNTSVAQDMKKEMALQIATLFKNFAPERTDVYAGQFPIKCIRGNAPTLAVTARLYGKDTACRWLLLQVNAYIDNIAMDENKKPTVEVIKSMANIIYMEYSYLKLTEIMLFFYLLKTGRFIELYGYIDSAKICNAMRKFILYRNEKIKEIENVEREIKREQYKKNSMTYEQYQEYLKAKQNNQ